MINIYGIDLSCGCSLEQSQVLYKGIWQERKDRIIRISNDDLRQRKILTSALMQYGVASYLNIPMQEIAFKEDEHGRPLYAGTGAEPERILADCNLTHSGDYAFFAVGDVPLGIDCEGVRDKYMHIAKRFFAQEEYEKLERMAGGNPEGSNESAFEFARMWTLKEAYAKFTGKGLSEGFDQFCFRTDEENVSGKDGILSMGTMHMGISYESEKKCYGVYQYMEEEQMFLSLCVEDKKEAMRFIDGIYSHIMWINADNMI